jgi:hypothetical protein
VSWRQSFIVLTLKSIGVTSPLQKLKVL